MSPWDHGVEPSQINSPIDHRSASAPKYSCPLTSSGAAYAGDPQHVFNTLSIPPEPERGREDERQILNSRPIGKKLEKQSVVRSFLG